MTAVTWGLMWLSVFSKLTNHVPFVLLIHQPNLVCGSHQFFDLYYDTMLQHQPIHTLYQYHM